MSQIPRAVILCVTLHLLSIVSAQELEKRGYQRFPGRGLKPGDGTEQFYKRRPQFFVGVKGKKSYSELLEPDSYKRAPMGFMGMRGKKDQFSDETKRGPMGFVGMRGKKYVYLEEPYDTDYLKRPLIGQYDSNENQYPLLNQLLIEYLKTERPKPTDAADSTESEDRFTNEVDKRAASIHQFFGVRGKRSLEHRSPLHGKFIGSRGKRDAQTRAQEIKFLLDNGPVPKRKGGMGFIGMRGKKWTDYDADDSSLESDSTN